jgi:hypothetical protein
METSTFVIASAQQIWPSRPLRLNFYDDLCTDSVTQNRRARHDVGMARVSLVSWHLMRPAIERAVLAGTLDIVVEEAAH